MSASNMNNVKENTTDSITPNEMHEMGRKEQNAENEIEEPITMAKRIKKIYSFVTVEPFLWCYLLPSVISALAIQKLNMEKACRADLNYTEEICKRVINGDVDGDLLMSALNEAQILNADMTAWKQPLLSGIPAIIILFVGAWSDRTGNRKALMIIPILGEIVSSIGMLLATYFFLEWPLWATALIEAVPPAFCGGISIALMGSYSYIADVTSVESRTLRMGLVAIIVTLSVPLGTAVSGVLTEALGYYGIFCLGLAFYIIGFIHTYYAIKDVRRTETEGTSFEKIKQFFHPLNVWDTISIIFKSRGRRIQIVLVICAHIVIIGPAFAEAAVLYFYTLKKFQMDVVEFSLFLTYSTCMSLAGTTVAVFVFSKWLKMHDALLGIIATACKVISSFVYGLAPTKDWFYSGPAFDFFGNSGVTAIRSLGTKVVEPDQVGKMCSLIGFVEAVVPVIYTPIYSKLYSNTLDTTPGAFYLLGGGMTIPAFFIFIALYIWHKKQERDVPKNPEVKETHAYYNDVTAL